MALNNVPLSGQNLQNTRVPINQNFSTIDSTFSIDHVAYNTSGGGKHNKITFPVQALAPVFAAGDDGIYNKLYAGTGLNELFIHQQYSAGTRDIPFTATTGNTIAGVIGGAGYTYLPSGLLVKWGVDTRTGDSGTVTMPATGSGGIAIPAFSICFWMGVNTYPTSVASDTDVFAAITQFGANFYRVYCSPRTTTGAKSVRFTWIAIGIGV